MNSSKNKLTFLSCSQTHTITLAFYCLFFFFFDNLMKWRHFSPYTHILGFVDWWLLVLKTWSNGLIALALEGPTCSACQRQLLLLAQSSVRPLQWDSVAMVRVSWCIVLLVDAPCGEYNIYEVNLKESHTNNVKKLSLLFIYIILNIDNLFLYQPSQKGECIKRIIIKILSNIFIFLYLKINFLLIFLCFFIFINFLI